MIRPGSHPTLSLTTAALLCHRLALARSCPAELRRSLVEELVRADASLRDAATDERRGGRGRLVKLLSRARARRPPPWQPPGQAPPPRHPPGQAPPPGQPPLARWGPWLVLAREGRVACVWAVESRRDADAVAARLGFAGEPDFVPFAEPAETPQPPPLQTKGTHLANLALPCMLVRAPAPERELTADAPRLRYRRRRGERKASVHWGQRKLLLSEVEFLTRMGARDRDWTVVYAGAAPGTHLALLAELFPRAKLVLVDPAPFRVGSTAQMTVRQEFFTDAVAAEFAGRDDVLFISDVRTADWRLMDAETVERTIAADMAAQRRWHERMAPAASLLKFRLPWDAPSARYLAGTVLLPVWGPLTTTEARLLVTQEREREWDARAYCEQMFHFNCVTRVAASPHGVRAVGLCACYDCAAEVAIWRAYGGDDGLVARLVEQATAACANGSGRSLRSRPAADPGWFRPREYDAARGTITEREADPAAARPDDAVLANAATGAPVCGELQAWLRVAEPTLADVPQPARAGVLGLGTAVPAGAVAYRWALGVAGASLEDRLQPAACIEPGSPVPPGCRFAPCPAGEQIVLVACESGASYALHWAHGAVRVTRVALGLDVAGVAVADGWLAPDDEQGGVALVLRSRRLRVRDARVARVAGVVAVCTLELGDCAERARFEATPAAPYGVDGLLLESGGRWLWSEGVDRRWVSGADRRE